MWFGARSEQKVIEFLRANLQLLFAANALPNAALLKILDVGCGNGHFLASLAASKALESVFSAHQILFWGVDFSAAAVRLAGEYLASRNVQAHIAQCDILHNETLADGNFGLIFDKGTFDAICLMPIENAPPKAATAAKNEASLANRKQFVKEHILPRYAAFIAANICVDAGYFVITSCNWTSGELRHFFTERCGDAAVFEVVHEIEHAKFVFGNATGSTIATLVLKIKRNVC